MIVFTFLLQMSVTAKSMDRWLLRMFQRGVAVGDASPNLTVNFKVEEYLKETNNDLRCKRENICAASNSSGICNCVNSPYCHSYGGDCFFIIRAIILLKH